MMIKFLFAGKAGIFPGTFLLDHYRLALIAVWLAEQLNATFITTGLVFYLACLWLLFDSRGFLHFNDDIDG